MGGWKAVCLCELCEGEEREGEEEGRAGSRYIPSGPILSCDVLCCAVLPPPFPPPLIQAGRSGGLYPPLLLLPSTTSHLVLCRPGTYRPILGVFSRHSPHSTAWHEHEWVGAARQADQHCNKVCRPPRPAWERASHAPVRLHLQTETHGPVVPD